MLMAKRTEIECIMCSNAIKFPEYVGQDYDGDLLCDTCGSSMRIKLTEWEVIEFTVLQSAQWINQDLGYTIIYTMGKADYIPLN